jgi:hypothetical protein
MKISARQEGQVIVDQGDYVRLRISQKSLQDAKFVMVSNYYGKSEIRTLEGKKFTTSNDDMM